MDAIAKHKASLDAVTGQIDSLLGIDPPSLRRDEFGSELGFSVAEPVFARIHQTLSTVRNSILSQLPGRLLEEMNQKLSRIRQIYDQIRQFNVREGDQPVQRRDRLINDLSAAEDELFPFAANALALGRKPSEAEGKLLEDARQLVVSIQSSQLEAKALTEKGVQEVTQTLEKVRSAATEVGVTQHSSHFKLQADEHKTDAAKWLKATIWLGVATICVAVLILLLAVFVQTSFTTSQSIQIGIAKVILFSMLSFGTVWAGRIYRAHRHNYVINKHRQNALSSFEAFVKGASDLQTKNAVLLQATQAIFCQTNSGFSTSESDGGGSTQILELVRGVAGDGGKSS